MNEPGAAGRQDSLLARRVEEAATAIRERLAARPRLAIVLGSGLSAVAAAVRGRETMAMAAIPHWPVPAVRGHRAQLVAGTIADVPVLCALGRVHLYEGFSPAQVTFSVRTLAALGVETLVVTNAAGALNPAFARGDLMVIRDHIFLPGLVGQSPLVGLGEDEGPRFVPMAGAYDAALRRLALDQAGAQGLAAREGVYVMVWGPQYESHAEAAWLRQMGADAVGMSSLPEVVVARQVGLRVLGLSCITNVWGAHEEPDLGHDAVLHAAAGAAEPLARLLQAVCTHLV